MKFQRIAVLVGLMALLVMPELAYAQSGGPGVGMLQRVLDWLGGSMARTVAGIAAVIIGYGCWDGRIEWDKIKAYVVGGGIVFGYAQIVSLVSNV